MLDTALITLVSATTSAESATQVHEELVILERGGMFAVARRDWRGNQWLSPRKTSSAPKPGSLDAGWNVGEGFRTLAQAQGRVRRLLGAVRAPKPSTEWDGVDESGDDHEAADARQDRAYARETGWHQ